MLGRWREASGRKCQAVQGRRETKICEVSKTLWPVMLKDVRRIRRVFWNAHKT